MKQRIKNYLFRHLLNAVVVEDILVADKTGIYIGGYKIEDSELKQLIAEAKAMEGFRLWKIINETVKDHALKRGWNNSTSVEDLNTGKTMFHTLDIQNSIVKLLKGKGMV